MYPVLKLRPILLTILHITLIIFTISFSLPIFLLLCKVLLSFTLLYLSSYDKYTKILTIFMVYKCLNFMKFDISPIIFILYGVEDFLRILLLEWIKKWYMMRLMSEDRKLMVDVKEYFIDCDAMFESLVTGVEEIVLVPREILQATFTDSLDYNVGKNDDICSSDVVSDHTVASDDLPNIPDEEECKEINMKSDAYIDSTEDFDEESTVLDQSVDYKFHDTPIIDSVLPENFYQYKGKFITKESIHKNISDKKKADKLYRLLTFYDTEPLNYEIFKNYHVQLTKEYQSLNDSLLSANNILFQLNVFLLLFQVSILITAIFLFVNKKYIFIGMLLSTLNFLFLSSCKKIVDAFFFLVITHPFDCGDRVSIKNENMIVKKTTIFNTIFERWDGRLMYINNCLLKNATIGNVRRSKRMKWEQTFCTSDTNGMFRVARDMESVGCKVFKEVIEESYMCKYRFVMVHKWNFQSVFFMWKEHNKFEKAMLDAIKKYNVRYVPLTNRYAILRKDKK